MEQGVPAIVGLVEEAAPAEAGSLAATGLACVWRLLESRVGKAPGAGLPVEHLIRMAAAANLGHRLVRVMHALAKHVPAQVSQCLSLIATGQRDC